MKIKSPLLNFIPVLSIPIAVYLPQIGKLFSPYTSWLLGALLFFSFCGISFDALIKAVKKPIKPFFVSIVILLVAPLVVFPIMERFFPIYLLGALIFMLLPSAVSSPAIASIYNGNVPFATVNAVFSNLLSPFTIPLFLVLFIGASVEISTAAMLLQLLIIIVIPFVLGLIANSYTPKFIEKTKSYYRPINLFLLFLLFFAILSPYSKELVGNLLNGHLWLAVFIVHLVLYFFSKLTVLHATSKSEKISIESNMMFLNIGLAVVIVQNYFGPTEMLFIIFCEIFWVVLVGLFKFIK
ncbi:bile acid:sodium symporter [Patescibacteria group bacterium]|nr:bile acid:sodium symporter [Patescibacteria group bacterium]MBU1682429.1 bile acid:sodium symporter [Patescibacteria group bacterium]MBU1934718.1 bile acid:sodium symporter [Patescibacteria group bacterium]